MFKWDGFEMRINKTDKITFSQIPGLNLLDKCSIWEKNVV